MENIKQDCIKVTVFKGQTRGLTYPQIRRLVYDKLIKQESIDIGYYSLYISSVEEEYNMGYDSVTFYIVYTLVKRECWDELETVEERLRIGL